MKLSRPIRAVIDLAALRHNYAVARGRAPNARAWAVIKADAYGHGQWRAVQALRGLADGFALLEAENAADLRAAGVDLPLLLLEGVFASRDARLACEFGLTTVLHSREQYELLAAAAGSRPLPPLYVKLNTGMNRLGFTAADLPWLRQTMARLPAGTVTLMTHFAEADGGRGIDWQLARFRDLSEGWQGPVSLANSAAILRHPASHGDWVRPGIMLYGASPFADQAAADLGLQPAMTLESSIIAVQDVTAGERVGYGGLFEAPRAMRVGIVACGYADGYPRHAGTGTPIAVLGRRTQTLGRVSMDMLACDLTDIPEAGLGAPVTLWGRGAAGEVPADAVAAAAGTIAYELFCALAPRVPVQVTDAS